jgi:rRNA processing protein Gar1
MGLKLVGRIQDISYNGFLVARGEFTPRIGSEVFAGNKPLGRIVNIYGPVTKPYLAIKPISKGQSLLEMVGKEIYLQGN